MLAIIAFVSFLVNLNIESSFISTTSRVCQTWLRHKYITSALLARSMVRIWNTLLVALNVVARFGQSHPSIVTVKFAVNSYAPLGMSLSHKSILLYQVRTISP